MPSEKRQRQRERHQVKVAAEQIRSRRNRRIRSVVGAVIVAGLVVGFIALISGGGSKKVATTTTTTTPTVTTAIAPTCPPASGSKKRYIVFTHAPGTCISPTGVFDAKFTTDVGSFTVEMHASSSLAAVNDIVFLARYHFYDHTIFHRVIPGFVIQGGDPTATPGGASNGTGGPGYSFTGNTPPATCTAKKDCYATGEFVLANSGKPSSDASQFFVILPGGASSLSDSYTRVGKVISGMTVVEAIGADGTAAGTPQVVHKLQSVTISTRS